MSAHPLQRLLHYGRNYRRQIWIATTCSVTNKFFDLAPPILIGMAVDTVTEQNSSFLAKLGIVDVTQQLVLLSVLTILIWAFESAFEYAYERLWRNIAQNVQHDLRLETYNHIQQLEMGFFENQSTGGLLAILNDDVNQLERFLDIGANEILQVTTTVILISIGFVVMAPSVAWMTMIPIPIIIWGSIAFQKLLAPRYGEVRERVSLLNARLANNISGITTIKSFTTEAYEVDRLAAESNAYRRSNLKAITLSAAFVPLIRIVILVGFTATLLIGGMETVEGRLAVGTYSVLVFMTQRLLWPLTRLGRTLDEYQRSMASTTRLMNLLDTPITIRSGHLDLPPVQGAVKLANVSFAYSDRAPTLENLTLDIPAGQTIGIAGSTGSGKSTLVKLLLRFYEIQSGQILLDGLDIREIHLHDLRGAIGLVSQDVFLFHGSVRENIAYGSPDATEPEIITAAKQAEAHDFIMQLPQGYETIVGERGQKLSGGQRQRLAIARAILKNPPILILDEATSAVDNETEAAISRSLARITQNRTTIAIAHRLSTIRNSDRIYVLEHGKIVEAGRHEELLAQDGVYAGLWRVQTGSLKESWN